jgi:hypothetical protein
MLWRVNILEHLSVVRIYQRKVRSLREVTDVVLEGKYPRAFTQVFDQTQIRLQSVFRMRLAELPAKERHETIQQQRRSMRFDFRINK